jgi:hypothetical protein
MFIIYYERKYITSHSFTVIIITESRRNYVSRSVFYFCFNSSDIKNLLEGLDGVLEDFSGSTDCMIPSLLSISLIYVSMSSMAFIFLATSTSGYPSSSLLRTSFSGVFYFYILINYNSYKLSYNIIVFKLLQYFI